MDMWLSQADLACQCGPGGAQPVRWLKLAYSVRVTVIRMSILLTHTHMHETQSLAGNQMADCSFVAG